MRKVEKEDENLKDTFVSVFFVGGFIVALWFAVFSLYLARLRV
ncbi:MAG: cytochrome C oxidase subunit II [Alicyclobacillaceae bacterium]|nr:cytochrome C oxidase subunit II [Alicyclobacillaceae bacterium]